MCRAIVAAWVIIVTTGIPAALSHGVVNYPYGGRNYTACLFLSEEGYNLVAFQVTTILFLFSSRVNLKPFFNQTQIPFKRLEWKAFNLKVVSKVEWEKFYKMVRFNGNIFCGLNSFSCIDHKQFLLDVSAICGLGILS